MRITAWMLTFGTLLLMSGAQAADPDALINSGRVLAFEYGSQLWPGFEHAPFGVLLVEGEHEVLYCHEGPAAEFKPVTMAPEVSGCSAKTRAATFPPSMLASFPAVDGKPTVVMGTPDATNLSEQNWLLVLQHEHFHQMQYAWEGYYSGVDALDLKGGDESGMWMLNYAFPYDSPAAAQALRRMASALLVALESAGSAGGQASLAAYWRAREGARSLLSEADWRYLELQLWQEGVARWTEMGIASLAPAYADAAEARRSALRLELATFDLSKRRRGSFYALGAAEAWLLESTGQPWRSAYWAEPFSLRGSIQKLVRELSSGHSKSLVSMRSRSGAASVAKQ